MPPPSCSLLGLGVVYNLLLMLRDKRQGGEEKGMEKIGGTQDGRYEA